MKIEGALKSLKGVVKESISVLFNASKVKLLFNDQDLSIETIQKAISRVGFEVLKTQVKD